MGAPEHQMSRAGLLRTSKPSGQPQQPASPRPSCPPACSAPHRALQRGAWAAGQHAGRGHGIVQLSVAGLLRSRNGGGRCSGLTRALRAPLCGALPCHGDRLGMNPSGHLHRRNGCGEAPPGLGLPGSRALRDRGYLGAGAPCDLDTPGKGPWGTGTLRKGHPRARALLGARTPLGHRLSTTGATRGQGYPTNWASSGKGSLGHGHPQGQGYPRDRGTLGKGLPRDKSSL